MRQEDFDSRTSRLFLFDVLDLLLFIDNASFVQVHGIGHAVSRDS